MESLESIPVLDCSKIVGSKTVERDDLINFSKEFGGALSGIGFTYLINHGVDLRKV